jgi:hypothetical protein
MQGARLDLFLREVGCGERVGVGGYDGDERGGWLLVVVVVVVVIMVIVLVVVAVSW